MTIQILLQCETKQTLKIPAMIQALK